MKRFYFYILASLMYITYYHMFFRINKASLAVLQVEDSDIAYAIGSTTATSTLPTVFYWYTIFLIFYSVGILVYNNYSKNDS